MKIKPTFVIFFCLLASGVPNAVADEPLHAQIDRLIEEKAGAAAADRASDEEFLRRVSLDLAGRVPSATEARSFLGDSDPAKRQKTIDRLLASPDYPRRMAELFHVMLLERLGEHEEWIKYLRQSFEQNRPWDQMVKDMLYPIADDESRRGAALFLSKRLENYGQNPVDYPGLVRDVGRLFLGIDVQCAQCHDHLFIDEYKQEYYQGLFAFLGQATLRSDVKFPAVAEQVVTKKVAFKSVFVQVEKMIGPRLPGANHQEVAIPVFEKGEEYVTPPDKKTKVPGVPKFSPLQVLAEQLPVAGNDLFTRNIANRLWWVMMGRGLVHPLDLHHKDNPASHPALLDLLAKELAGHQFDIKWLLREIALSEAYQRSGQLPAGASAIPVESYGVFLEKPLSAEQLALSLVQVTDTSEPVAADGDVSKGMRERFLKAFANPPREPEGDHAPSLKAALFLMNDEQVLKRFESRENHLIARLEKQTDAKLLADELYLAVLTRRPTAEEMADVVAHLETHAQDRSRAIRDLAWSLVASTEFLVNH